MRFMNEDDFLLARTAPIRPTQSFLDELILNGKSPQFTEKPHAIGDFENGQEPIQLYVGARGYNFEWGHIIEDLSVQVIDGKMILFASWNFCFEGLLADFHQRGLHLDDLNILCEQLLTDHKVEPRLGKQIPSYVKIDSGDEASAFELIAFGEEEYGVEAIRNAREWLALVFLNSMLEKLMCAVKKSLRLR